MPEGISLAFHGAARVVTGSKHLLQVGSTRVLLDAGMFQGPKRLRELNWQEPPFAPRSLDHVLVTHSHIDHIGYLPRLARLGLRAPVHCTPAAYELAELMLLDAAHIQEEDARYANKKGYSRHDPALPLYDTKDARRALRLRKKQRYNQWLRLDRKGRLRARFLNAGHILGSSFIELSVPLGEREIRIVYSGDLGRFEMPLHLDPRGLRRSYRLEDIVLVATIHDNHIGGRGLALADGRARPGLGDADIASHLRPRGPSDKEKRRHGERDGDGDLDQTPPAQAKHTILGTNCSHR